MAATKEVQTQEFATIRLPKELVRKLGVVCQFADKSIAQTVADWIESRVNREYKAVAEKMNTELGGEGG